MRNSLIPYYTSANLQLRSDIGMTLTKVMKEQQTPSKALAADLYPALKLSFTSTQSLISSFRAGYATGLNHRKHDEQSRKAPLNERELERLALVFSALRLDADHTIITRIRQDYPLFTYSSSRKYILESQV